MKLNSLLEAVSQNTLIGRLVGDYNGYIDWTHRAGATNAKKKFCRKVTPETRNETWEGNFYVEGWGMKSLDGSPKRVTGNYTVSWHNSITDLKGSPEIVDGDYNIGTDKPLTSFDGAPRKVGKNVHLYDCGLKSLQNVHKFKEINGEFVACDNPIKSHVLGLLLIKGLKNIELANTDTDTAAYGAQLLKAQKILNKYLPEGRAGLTKCQNELIEAGLEEYAQI